MIFIYLVIVVNINKILQVKKENHCLKYLTKSIKQIANQVLKQMVNIINWTLLFRIDKK